MQIKGANHRNSYKAEEFGTFVELDEASDRALLGWLRTITPDLPEAAQTLEAALPENPGRISRAFREMLSGYASNPVEVLKMAIEVPAEGHHGLVAAIQIPFLSFCAHHFLPFFGSVDIVYEPGAHIVGIGKIPRLVDCRARRFQLQELLVKELSEDLMTHAQAKGVYVLSLARHTCVCYRGPSQSMVLNKATYSLGTLNSLDRFNEIMVAMRSS